MMPNTISPMIFCLLALGCFALTLLLTPLVMRFALRLEAVDREGHRGVYKGKAMPLMGGLAIGIPFILVCLAEVARHWQMLGTFTQHDVRLLAMAFGGCGILLLGMVDDLVGLGARSKFIGQFLFACMPCLAGYTIEGIDLPFYGRLEFGFVVGTGLTLLWVVGLTNAYNLIDGMDGLASGLALIAAVGLGVIALLNGSAFSALMCAALFGSLGAFLIFNFHPARIFLGDTGSMFLGFALANITLMGSLKTTGAIIFLAPVLVLGLPIMDTMISILRRYVRGRPLFKGDQGHLHHRLLKQGYSQRASALIFYVIAAVMTASAVIGWALPPHSRLAWITTACYGLAMLAVIRIADLRLPVLLKMAKYHKRNMLLNSLSRYVSMRLSYSPSNESSSDEKILCFICQELCLRRLAIEAIGGQTLIECDRANELPPGLPGQPVWRTRVRTANKYQVQLAFQPEQELDELTLNDIQDCLAGIFENKNFMPFVPPAPAATKENGLDSVTQAVRTEKPIVMAE